MGKKAKSVPETSAVMAKKASPAKAKVPTPAGVQKPAVKKTKPSSPTKGKGKKASDEIEDIFTASKKEVKSKAAVEPVEAIKSKAAPRVTGTKDDIFGENTGPGRKKTDEGWNIYTEDELNLGKQGGDTDLCPFDCDCCF